jgi:hypothetical protein
MNLEETVREHFEHDYAARAWFQLDEEFRPDDEQPYDDRILGYLGKQGEQGTRAVVVVRFVGPDNAARYRRWITVPPAVYESMTRRPQGWRFFVLMVGLLPDGQPWWSALYDERVLARPDVYPFAEAMVTSGRFYRFDPHLAERALLAEHDFTEPAQFEAHLFHSGTCTGCGEAFELAVPVATKR